MSSDRRLSITMLVLAMLAMPACDRMPVDVQESGMAAALLLDRDASEAAAPPNSLPRLLHEAIHRVYTNEGSESARAVVADLQRLREARGGAVAWLADVDGAASDDSAIRAEEIRLVLSVLGTGVVPRVVDGVRTDADRLRDRVAGSEASGRELSHASTLFAETERLLELAAARLAEGSTASALDAATRAAVQVHEVRTMLLRVSTLPTLESLFDDAVTRLRLLRGPVHARNVLERFGSLQDAAAEAVRSGDRDRAHAALTAVRREQVAVVLHVLGPDMPQRQLAIVRVALRDAGAAIERSLDAGRDVHRLERMLAVARDIEDRAADAMRAGRFDDALDLASHAASLINALNAELIAT